MASSLFALVVALALTGTAVASKHPLTAQIMNMTLPANGCTSIEHELHGNTNYTVVFQSIEYPEDGLLCTPSDVLASKTILTEETCFRQDGSKCAEYYSDDSPRCVAVRSLL